MDVQYVLLKPQISSTPAFIYFILLVSSPMEKMLFSNAARITLKRICLIKLSAYYVNNKHQIVLTLPTLCPLLSHCRFLSPNFCPQFLAQFPFDRKSLANARSTGCFLLLLLANSFPPASPPPNGSCPSRLDRPGDEQRDGRGIRGQAGRTVRPLAVDCE
jgi:hypothetical protein